MNWFKKRLKEPTTYIGLGLFSQAVMILTKADPSHTELVSHIATQSAEPLANGDYTTALTIGLGGLMGVLMGEKGR
ncbi:MAG: hypothetical protein ACPGRX_04740 [Bdellovibrionales bacterium]